LFAFRPPSVTIWRVRGVYRLFARGEPPVCRPAVSFPQSIAPGDPSRRRSEMKTSVLSLLAAALVACGGAQAHLLLDDSVSSATSSKSTLAVMTAAGIRYHAAANYKNEQRIFGASSATKSSGDRPDNRAGIRGV
jgi:hypothetical protein